MFEIRYCPFTGEKSLIEVGVLFLRGEKQTNLLIGLRSLRRKEYFLLAKVCILRQDSYYPE